MTDNLTLNMDAYLPLRDVVFNTLREAILKGEDDGNFALIEVHGQTHPCYYYKGEHNIRAPLIYREDLAH